MSYSGQKKISIYDPATGIVVQLNDLDEQGTYEKPPITYKGAKGSLKYAGETAKLEFRSTDPTGFDQLEAWMKAKTPVRAVSYGLEDHILWYEDTELTVSKDTGFKVGNLNGFTVNMQREGKDLDIWSGANLLDYFGWKDEDGDGIVDGAYSYNESINMTHSFEEQTMNITFNEDGKWFQHFWFVYPLSDVLLKAKMSILNQTCALQHSEIGIRSFESDFLWGGGFQSADNYLFRTPNNSWLIQFFLFNYSGWDVVSGDVLAYKQPYLGV